MATRRASSASSRLKQDRLSILAVGIVTAIALLLGTILKTSVENRSQHIERKGISASFPANWVVEEGVGDLIFVGWDPFVPNVRYMVSLEPNEGDHQLAEVASQRNTNLENIMEAFRVLNETPIIRRGRDGYKVTYAFIDTNTPGLPIVLQGVDYYFPVEGKAMIISLQAHEQDYEEALLRFESFLDSVIYTPGE